MNINLKNKKIMEFCDYAYIGLYVNGVLIWKCSDWREYDEVAKEQKEYHRGEDIKITYKYLNE